MVTTRAMTLRTGAPILQSPTRLPSPSVPVSPPNINPPDLWTWRCHSCGTYYALSITQYCLQCGHKRCTPTSNPYPNKRRRRGRGYLICPQIFDQHGWELWSKHRRALRGAKAVARRNIEKGWPTNYRMRSQRDVAAYVGEEERQERLKKGEGNCWEDCDFPGQCREVKRFERRLDEIMQRDCEMVMEEEEDEEEEEDDDDSLEGDEEEEEVYAGGDEEEEEEEGDDDDDDDDDVNNEGGESDKEEEVFDEVPITQEDISWNAYETQFSQGKG